MENKSKTADLEKTKKDNWKQLSMTNGLSSYWDKSTEMFDPEINLDYLFLI